MTLQQIVVPSSLYNLDLACTLGAQDYVLGLKYNTRLSQWICDVKDSTGATLAGGILMNAGRNLLAGYYSNPAIPRGALFVFDTTGAGSPPTKDSFSSTHQLLFAAL